MKTKSKIEPRKLESIQIERRFGGFLPVLRFVDGSTENAAANVFQNTKMALAAANKWIATPAYNIDWWK